MEKRKRKVELFTDTTAGCVDVVKTDSGKSNYRGTYELTCEHGIWFATLPVELIKSMSYGAIEISEVIKHD